MYFKSYHNSFNNNSEVAMKSGSRSAIGMYLCIALCCSILSCSDSNSPNSPLPTGSSETGVVAGRVLAYNNYPIKGVLVSIGSLVGYTDENGEFYITNVPVSQKVLVNFSNEWYGKMQKVTQVNANKISYVKAALQSMSKYTLDASAGGTFQVAAATVQFPANALVDSKGKAFTGTAQLKAAYFGATAQLFFDAFPGDFTGVRTNGTSTPIESYGHISVELYNGTEKLQLAAGAQATITVPIPPQLLAAAPPTIPMWYYDETKGSWMEEGSATKTGSTYVGTVKHFSYWNWDLPTETSYLEGTVVDQNGNQLVFIPVISQGKDYSGSSNVVSIGAGHFRLPVKANSTASVWAQYYVVTSKLQTIATPAVGQTKDIGVLTLTLDAVSLCTIIGTLVDNGNRPVSCSVHLKDKDGFELESFQADIDGKYRFIGSCNTTYTIVFGSGRDPLEPPTPMTFTTPAIGPTMDLGNTKLDIGGTTIIGRVLDPASNLLEDVRLYTRPESACWQGNRTDAQGRFSLWVRPNITFDLYFRHVVPTQDDSIVTTKIITVTSSSTLGQTKDLGDIVVQ